MANKMANKLNDLPKRTRTADHVQRLVKAGLPDFRRLQVGINRRPAQPGCTSDSRDLRSLAVHPVDDRKLLVGHLHPPALLRPAPRLAVGLGDPPFEKAKTAPSGSPAAGDVRH